MRETTMQPKVQAKRQPGVRPKMGATAEPTMQPKSQPAAPRRAQPAAAAARSICRMRSPLGEILLVANERGDALAGLYLERQKYYPVVPPAWHASPRLPIFREAIRQLREYFAGTRSRFELALDPAGTPFQRRVWREIAAVPGGT